MDAVGAPAVDAVVAPGKKPRRRRRRTNNPPADGAQPVPAPDAAVLNVPIDQAVPAPDAAVVNVPIDQSVPVPDAAVLNVSIDQPAAERFTAEVSPIVEFDMDVPRINNGEAEMRQLLELQRRLDEIPMNISGNPPHPNINGKISGDLHQPNISDDPPHPNISGDPLLPHDAGDPPNSPGDAHVVEQPEIKWVRKSLCLVVCTKQTPIHSNIDLFCFILAVAVHA